MKKQTRTSRSIATPKKKLSLRKESLRKLQSLSDDELGNVAGGNYMPSYCGRCYDGGNTGFTM